MYRIYTLNTDANTIDIIELLVIEYYSLPNAYLVITNYEVCDNILVKM